MTANPHLLAEAEIVARIEESPSIFTLQLRFTDPERQREYCFQPGQFNMVYLFGVGEIPISIVSDPSDAACGLGVDDDTLFDHTIRIVGRVSRGLARLQVGDRLGIRGPYGRGWPLDRARDRDIVVITGGLGCAPSVSVIEYIMRRREDYGHLTIMQGVKHVNDMLWHERYEVWAQHPDTQVLLAADAGGPIWPWHKGPVLDLFDQANIRPQHSLAMLCGPEGMMKAAIRQLLQRGLAATDIWLSMERNMQCALGQCGHCQYGSHFVCKDGPVFCYAEIQDLFDVRGL